MFITRVPFNVNEPRLGLKLEIMPVGVLPLFNTSTRHPTIDRWAYGAQSHRGVVRQGDPSSNQ